MKKLFIKTLFLSVLCVLNSSAQGLKDYTTGFVTIFDKTDKVNPYYISSNPAYLNHDLSEEILYLTSGFYNEEGSFRRFVDPGNIRNYILTASGKKEIDSFQVFKGSFSFSRKENNDWQWIFSRDYAVSPFLIGDSTTGNTRLNGIIMNAEYSNRLFDLLGVGLAVNYGVDQGLKQISPRPTSKNREFLITAGMSYDILKNLSAGIKVSLYDDVETINYREDEGALTTETVILKFRGYDFPNVFRKKTETRYSYNNGFLTGLDLVYNNSAFKAGLSVSGGLNKINVKDDAINPVSDGFWKNNYGRGVLLLNSSLSENLKLGFNYIFNYSENWAENLNYQVLYNKNNSLSNNGSIGIEYTLNDKTVLGAEADYGLSVLDINDYYSLLSSKVNTSDYSVMLGLKKSWNENFTTFVSAGYGKNDISKGEIRISSQQGDYYSQFRYRDIYYYMVPGSSYNLHLIASYMPEFGGEIILNLRYFVKSSGENSYLRDVKRESTDVYLEYRVEAY